MRVLRLTACLLLLAAIAPQLAGAQGAPTGWWERITLRGDFRLRHEAHLQDGVDDRHRVRIRLRLGLTAPVTPTLEVGVRLATGVAGAVTSTNQTLDDAFSPKSFNVDQAYVRFRPEGILGVDRRWLSLTGGKFGSGWMKPASGVASELLLDGDLAPEGFSEELLLVDRQAGLVRRVSVLAEQWVVDEVGKGADTWILLEQVRTDLALGKGAALTLAGGMLHTANPAGLAKARNGNSQLQLTNSVVLKDGTVVPGGTPLSPGALNPIDGFLHDFTVVTGMAMLEVTPRGWSGPVGLYMDLVHNADAPAHQNGIMLGAGLGQARRPGQAAFLASWHRVETDAVLSMFNSSDLGIGGTNLTGFVLNLDVAAARGVTLGVTDHIARRIVNVAGTPNPYLHRVHLTLQATF